MSEFIESKPPAQDQDSQGSISGPIQNPTPSFAESKPIHDSEDSKSGQNPAPTFAGPKQIQDSQVLKSGQELRFSTTSIM